MVVSSVFFVYLFKKLMITITNKYIICILLHFIKSKINKTKKLND